MRQPTEAQFRKINSMLENNPSMAIPDWGYYSSGSISLIIVWTFDPNFFYTQGLDTNGEFDNDGSGPWPLGSRKP